MRVMQSLAPEEVRHAREPSPWGAVCAEFDCEHDDTEIRKRTLSNGVVHYALQCIRCGENTRTVKKDSIPGLQRITLKPFDEHLKIDYRDRKQARFQQLLEDERERTEAALEAQSAEWWIAYSEYLESPQWQQKRAMILQRADNKCEGCLTRPATQVHHWTYDRVGFEEGVFHCNEFAWDLVAVCVRCHRRLHPDRWDGKDG